MKSSLTWTHDLSEGEDKCLPERYRKKSVKKRIMFGASRREKILSHFYCRNSLITNKTEVSSFSQHSPLTTRLVKMVDAKNRTVAASNVDETPIICRFLIQIFLPPKLRTILAFPHRTAMYAAL
uniref:Uncharacterized protein n=1 Tax=Romanomermis culicivorax TaxID=13658 RepID=A0A915KWP4_ROMCU